MSSNNQSLENKRPYLQAWQKDEQKLAQLAQKAQTVLTPEEWQFVLQYNNNFAKCQEFTRQYHLKTHKAPSSGINRAFITQMVQDELQELADAQNVTQEIDALVDAAYYIMQHVSRTNLPWQQIFHIVHSANMTKFSDEGVLLPNGKWQKPSSFVEPDADIADVIAHLPSI